jgi:two-component system nitrate/nitrite response regulator NarL
MPKVMIIEDDPSMFSLLQMLLEFEDYSVVGWNNGDGQEELIRTIQGEHPDLLLMDVNLRSLNGFEILDTIRKQPILGDVRVIMASGMDLAEQSEQRGADGFILKPFSPDDLLLKIKQTIVERA